MFTSNKQLLLLLNSFLNNTPSKLIIEPSDTESWKKLMQAANIHAVVPMVYDALSRVDKKELLDESMLKAYRQLSISKMGVAVTKSAEFLRLYKIIEEHGISPIVIKGSALACLYEKSGCRISSDEDILIEKNELEPLKAVLKKLNYELVDISEKGSVHHFHNEKTMLAIEAHISLFSQEEGTKKYAELFKDEIKTAKRNEFLVLDENYELLYLLCHAAKHFALSGFGIRQLCDIIILTKKYFSSLNFEWLLEKTKKVNLHVFSAAIFKAGEEYLGLTGVPSAFVKYATDTEPLLEDVLEGGVFGRSTSERERSLRITLNAVSNSKKNPVIRSLFPPYCEMIEIYPKLKNRTILLPVYWVMRIFKLAFIQKGNSVATIKKGTQRTKLLKRYGLGKEQ